MASDLEVPEQGKVKVKLLLTKGDPGKVKVKLLLTKGEQGKVKVKLLITKGEQGKVKVKLLLTKVERRKSKVKLLLTKGGQIKVKVKLLLTKGEQGKVKVKLSLTKVERRKAKVKLLLTKGEQGKAKKELFASKVESTSESGRERKMSSSSTGSMKNKWLKAFKSLKTGSGTNPTNGAPREADKKNGKETTTLQAANADPSVHAFQEYTYKKITPCDVCSQVLRGESLRCSEVSLLSGAQRCSEVSLLLGAPRGVSQVLRVESLRCSELSLSGHARQGLKCRVCKMNVHVDCQGQVGRCQPKSRLLRRQKSTSEIETRIPDALPDEESEYYPTSLSLSLTLFIELT
uniref:Phorbol-ester/DAG-type domain-containing protein n=1 Tax=Timema shepardi TaxID=629360 RepID=A0A7R9AYA0_TIMSH|nr:unnamed protein product [Timema shepardi]